MKKIIFALLWCYAIQAQTFGFSCNRIIDSIGESNYNQLMEDFNRLNVNPSFLNKITFEYISTESFERRASFGGYNDLSGGIIKFGSGLEYQQILHEVIHAYHWLVVPGAFFNEQIISLFGESCGVEICPDNYRWNDNRYTYYKKNQAEGFALSVQSYLGYRRNHVVSWQQIINEPYYHDTIVPFLDTLFE